MVQEVSEGVWHAIIWNNHYYKMHFELNYVQRWLYSLAQLCVQTIVFSCLDTCVHIIFSNNKYIKQQPAKHLPCLLIHLQSHGKIKCISLIHKCKPLFFLQYTYRFRYMIQPGWQEPSPLSNVLVPPVWFSVKKIMASLKDDGSSHQNILLV